MDRPKRRVLIIAYHYPPLAGAGMLKILRTTRYLAQYGWEPYVLTVKNPESYHRADNPIPETVRVFRSWRIPGANLLARVLRRLKLDERWLLLPDQYLFWLPGTLIYGYYLLQKHQIDLIYVTAPPYSALVCGALLKRLTGKPLVADIRDPWSFNAARRGYPTTVHRWWDRLLERWVLKTAAFVTCIYQITERGYLQRYPWLHNKIKVFYDTVDCQDLPTKVESYAKFTLTYLGTFYPPFHTLRATLRGIRLLLDEGAITPERFCFNYVGPRDKQFEQFVADHNLTAVVRYAGYKPLHEVQAETFKSQMLLLLLEFATINTKLFDYLAAGKAILAVVPEFPELQELLDTYADNYRKITDSDERKIAEYIKQCYNKYYQDGAAAPSAKQRLFIETLNIEKATEGLSSVFDEVIARR